MILTWSGRIIKHGGTHERHIGRVPYVRIVYGQSNTIEEEEESTEHLSRCVSAYDLAHPFIIELTLSAAQNGESRGLVL